MADNIDSISIELTADTSSAEASIQRLIDALRMLNAAAIDSAKESKIAQSVRNIAKAVRQVDSESSKNVLNLAISLRELGRVGDLSNLKDAARNLSGVAKAVKDIGKSDGIGSLASEVERVGSAFDGLKNVDTSKLEAVKDALSGETSGSLFESSKAYESEDLGGGSATYSTGGDMAAYGAMTVFKYVADSIRDATAAYHEFTAALGSGMPPIFTEFANETRESDNGVKMLTGSVENAMTVYKFAADSVRDAAEAFGEFKQTTGSGAGGVEPPIYTEFVDGADNAGNALMTLAQNTGIALPQISQIEPTIETSIQTFISFSGVLGTVGKGLAALGKGLVEIPKYFGGQLIGNVQKATKGFLRFFNQIKRIATYRLIRTALKLITQGISEGIKNLYNWSRTADHTFYNSMNTISTASQYIGNSFAAMVSPLINLVAPAIDFIADKIVDLFNLFNMVFARLAGQTSYTAAKKVSAQWSDASKSASGSAKKAADEIKRTLLGFDEINKLNDNNAASGSGGGGGGGGGSAGSNMFETLPIEGSVVSFVDQLKEAFNAGDWQGLGELLGGKINEVVESVNWAGAGQTVGYYINGWFSTKYWTLDTINFTNIGKHIAEFLNNAINEIDFNILGRLMVQKLSIIGDLVIGFFMEFDWGQAGEKLSNFVTGIFQELTKWIEKQDWHEIGIAIVYYIVDFFASADYSGMAKSISEFLGAALGAGIALISGIGQAIGEKIAEAFNGIGAFFEEQIEACGGDIVGGILRGIVVGLTNIGVWIVENIFQPFINGFKNAFGIASPAKTMEEPGKNIVLGIFQGIINALKNVGQWVKDNIFTPIWNAIKNAGETAISITVSLVKKVGEWASDVWDAIKAGAETIIKTISAVVGAVASFAGDVWTWIRAGAETVFKTVSAVVGAVASFAGDVWTWIRAGAETVFKTVSAVVGAVANFAGTIWDWVRKGAETVFKTVSAVAGAVASFAGDVWTWIRAGAETVVKTMEAVFGKVAGFFGDVWDFIKTGAGTIVKTVESALEKGADWAQDVWDFITGPARIIKEIVVSMANGEATGPSWGDTPEVKLPVGLDLENGALENFSGIVTTGWDGLPSDLKSLDVAPTVDDSNWQNEWDDFLGHPFEIDAKVNIVKGTIEEGIKGILGFVGKTGESAAVTISAGVQKATTWVADAWTALTAKDKSTTLSQGVKKSSTWNDDAYTISGRSGNVSRTLSQGVDTASVWNVLAYAMALLTGGTVTRTLSQKVEKNTAWNDNGYTAATLSGTTVYRTLNQKVEKNSTFNGEAYKAALVSGGTVYKCLNMKVEKNSTFNGEAYKAAFVSGGTVYKTIDVKVAKHKNWSDSAYNALNSGSKTITITVKMKSEKKTVVMTATKTATTMKFVLKRNGGIFENGRWRDIAKYAEGTYDAARYGSLFMAGEAGPELVGHVGGRTEVLNKSQLASAMYSAVRSAMAPAASNFSEAAARMSAVNGEIDMEKLAETVRQGVEQAMNRQNELDRQRNEYLRQINEKDYNPEISTSSINKAQQRMNRRAGMTIVPVGT